MSLHSINSQTNLHVVSDGSGSGPVLIFLHYWGGSSRTFAPLISNLSPGLRSLSIDFRGWGNSTGPKLPNAYSILDLALDVEALILKLEVKNFILIGHSMGGKVAQLISGRGQVRGLHALILIAPAPPTPLVLPADMKQTQMVAYNSSESAEFVVRHVLTSSMISSQAVKTLVGDIMKGNTFAKLAWPTYAILEDISAESKRINIPVLVIAGGYDKIEPLDRLQTEVIGIIKNAKMVVVVVEDSGHMLPIEAPSQVAKYIETFLTSISPVLDS